MKNIVIASAVASGVAVVGVVGMGGYIAGAKMGQPHQVHGMAFEHRMPMMDKAEMLKKAVEDKKLTQAQADHITDVHKQIKDLIGDKKRSELSQETKDKIKTLRDDLKKWMEDNKIDLPMHGHGLRGGHMMGRF